MSYPSTTESLPAGEPATTVTPPPPVDKGTVGENDAKGDTGPTDKEDSETTSDGSSETPVLNPPNPRPLSSTRGETIDPHKDQHYHIRSAKTRPLWSTRGDTINPHYIRAPETPKPGPAT